MNDLNHPDPAGPDRPGGDRLDAELAALRDSLRADARRTSDVTADLADVKAGIEAGIIPVTALPRRRSPWVAAALVAAASAVLLGLVVLTRDDDGGSTVPATEPSASSVPSPDSAPDATTVDTVVASTTTIASGHPLVPLAAVAHVTSISYGSATDGWAIVEQVGGTAALARTVGDGWVVASAPTSARSLYQVHFADEANGWLIGDGGWWSTHDGGVTWNALSNDTTSGPFSGLAIAGGWVLTLRVGAGDNGGYTVRVWRSPVGVDDFRPTDAAWPKGAGGNDVLLTAAADGTDVLVAENDRGGSTVRLHADGTVSPWTTPAAGRGGDIFLSGPAAGGPVWVESQTGWWGGDNEPQQVLAVAANGGAPFADVAPPEPVDMNTLTPRLCALSPVGEREAIAVMCDDSGARQYRTTDLGATWELIAHVGNAGGTWSWNTSVSPSGVLALFADHSSPDGTATSEVWIMPDSTSGWRKVLP